jgi:hypothetical protein
MASSRVLPWPSLGVWFRATPRAGGCVHNPAWADAPYPGPEHHTRVGDTPHRGPRRAAQGYGMRHAGPETCHTGSRDPPHAVPGRAANGSGIRRMRVRDTPNTRGRDAHTRVWDAPHAQPKRTTRPTQTHHTPDPIAPHARPNCTTRPTQMRHTPDRDARHAGPRCAACGSAPTCRGRMRHAGGGGRRVRRGVGLGWRCRGRPWRGGGGGSGRSSLGGLARCGLWRKPRGVRRRYRNRGPW